MNINEIINQPIKKEYQIPFVSSALVFENIVGFCFSDFCKQIYTKYKYHEAIHQTPEFLFSKMITLKGIKSQKRNARRLAVDLILLTNFPYRPWYICDYDQKIIDQFHKLNINLCIPEYLKFWHNTNHTLEHTYLGIMFGMFVDEATLQFDAVSFSRSLCEVINNHSLYKCSFTNNWFNHDKSLLALYETVHSQLNSVEHINVFCELTNIIFNVVKDKTQTLLMFKHYFSNNYSEEKEYAISFLSASNLSEEYDYSQTLYKNVLNNAITESDWDFFDRFFLLLSQELGAEHPDLIKIQESAVIKKRENLEKNFKSQETQIEEKHLDHIFSPHINKKVKLIDISTKDLFGLITLLEVVDESRGMLLLEQKLEYILPSRKAIFSLLYDLLSKHIITIEKRYFNSISNENVNDWSSYLNAPFEISLVDCIGNLESILDVLYGELKCRKDLITTCFNMWKSLANFYFYSSYEYYSGKITDDWIQQYAMKDDLEKQICDSNLSCKKLSYIAYSAVKNTTSFHHMESNGNRHTCNVMNYFLDKYLNLAKTSSHDYSRPRAEDAPKFQMERLINYITQIDYDDLYNLAPNIEYMTNDD